VGIAESLPTLGPVPCQHAGPATPPPSPTSSPLVPPGPQLWDLGGSGYEDLSLAAPPQSDQVAARARPQPDESPGEGCAGMPAGGLGGGTQSTPGGKDPTPGILGEACFMVAEVLDLDVFDCGGFDSAWASISTGAAFVGAVMDPEARGGTLPERGGMHLLLTGGLLSGAFLFRFRLCQLRWTAGFSPAGDGWHAEQWFQWCFLPCRV
jgi:hypothetical protein